MMTLQELKKSVKDAVVCPIDENKPFQTEMISHHFIAAMLKAGGHPCSISFSNIKHSVISFPSGEGGRCNCGRFERMALLFDTEIFHSCNQSKRLANHF